MKEEMYHLIVNAQSGNGAAMEKILLDNKGLVWAAVRKFNGRGVETDDLFQIGSMGLMKAVRKFDTEYNVEFSTYAVPMIIGEIRRFLRDDGMIKVSRNLKEIAVKVRSAEEKFRAENGRDATLSEIATIVNYDINDIAVSMEATQPVESIYRTVHEGDNNNVLLIDKIHSESSNEENIITLVALRQAIKNLPDKDRQILMLRYFKEKTQSEVAKIMGVSQVQISRIEKKLLGILKKDIG